MGYFEATMPASMPELSETLALLVPTCTSTVEPSRTIYRVRRVCGASRTPKPQEYLLSSYGVLNDISSSEIIHMSKK